MRRIAKYEEIYASKHVCIRKIGFQNSEKIMSSYILSGFENKDNN